MGARIFVLAGVNGAGKSSIGGAALEQSGGSFYNPDRQARELMLANPGLGQEEANSQAWELGRQGLERALSRGEQFMFETTLGANTLATMLMNGARAGAEVHLWFAGLATPELHIERVRSRVAHGGHDIPEAKIRQRYLSSLQNLVELMPLLTSLVVFDNSIESDPRRGLAPRPKLILRMRQGREITEMIAPADVPTWAKPVVMQALRLMKRNSKP
ncbi:AAA family ATPase [Pelomonas sp. KK5]|uniref:AAA family ATPase n=1 Tax=Pelomonas sp. KK5 TaxID=1855730 RepID=UPI0018E93FB2|nr:AAA family ATPase [Pelomonas sp. KK5]